MKTNLNWVLVEESLLCAARYASPL